MSQLGEKHQPDGERRKPTGEKREPDEETSKPTGEKHEPAWRQHLPWVATLVAFCYAAVKIAVISGGDPVVARAVVATSDLPTLLLGVGGLALPMLVGVVAFIALLATGASIMTKTPRAIPLSIAAISYIPLAIFAPPQALTAILSVSISTLFLLYAANRRAYEQGKLKLPANASWSTRIGRLLSDVSWKIRVAGFFAILGLLVPFWANGLGRAFDRTVWLPLEVVCVSADLKTPQGRFAPSDYSDWMLPCHVAITTTLSGSKRIVPSLGYVLQAGSEWTTVLLEDQRHVVRLPSKAIEARVLCRSPDAPGLKPILGSTISSAVGDEGMLVRLGAAEYRCYPSFPPQK